MPRKNYNPSFEAVCTSYKISKHTSIRKAHNFTVNRDRSYKNKETGVLPAPADIISWHFNSYNLVYLGLMRD